MNTWQRGSGELVGPEGGGNALSCSRRDYYQRPELQSRIGVKAMERGGVRDAALLPDLLDMDRAGASDMIFGRHCVVT
ncbi:hypothetical protein Vi05172_g2883 [Venturia inaequalis]|nr:hypothetical protein Vi05172_g2883 [Venturia inaequalis]